MCGAIAREQKLLPRQLKLPRENNSNEIHQKDESKYNSNRDDIIFFHTVIYLLLHGRPSRVGQLLEYGQPRKPKIDVLIAKINRRQGKEVM